MDFKDQQQAESDNNYDFFLNEIKKDNQILKDNAGKYALLRKKQIIGFFSTWGDAYQSGTIAFRDKVFSIQEVVIDTVKLGFIGYAVD